MRMPPFPTTEKTDVDFLNSLTKSESSNRVDDALGTQPVFENSRSICFNQANNDLCEAFALYQRSIKREGAKAWNDEIDRIVQKSQDDKKKDNPDISDWDVSNISVIPIGKGHELLHAFKTPTTVSFFTRVAPDQSGIGMTLTKHYNNGSVKKKYEPVIFQLLPEAKLFALPGTSYDPFYSPDYDARRGRGFIFGARGHSGSNKAKTYSFYLPGKFSSVKRDFYFSNISGYGTVAKITDPSVVSPKWASHNGDYVIMGKRWNWFGLKTKKNFSGKVTDVAVIDKAGTNRAHDPICSFKNMSFDKSDSMLSPDGRYISLKTNPHKVPVIVATRDCRIVNKDDLKGYYGGKASFSNNSRYMVFHGFGVNGKQQVFDQMSNNGLIRKLANQGIVANIFVYDINNRRVRQILSLIHI